MSRARAGGARLMLGAFDDVLYAEPNSARTAFRVPDDALFGYQWDHENGGQTVGGVLGRPTRSDRRRLAAVSTRGALGQIRGLPRCQPA